MSGPGMGADPLHHHGDAEATPGLLDFAVNVRLDAPPAWLRAVLVGALDGLGRYPDQTTARVAVAARHGRDVADVVLTAGAAEAFVLLARVLRPRRAVCVHPSFTQPEAALRAAGHLVERVVLPPLYELRPDLVPDDADLVVLGNPNNPTGVLHDARRVLSLARAGRTLVVDEAFIDTVPGERGSVSGGAGVPGLVVVRSLTKTWGLAGLRVGYLLASPSLVGALVAAQPPWAVSTPALAAIEACTAPSAVAEADAAARRLEGERRYLVEELERRGVAVVAPSSTSFVLARTPAGDTVRERLRHNGVAVRRGDTFPGLGCDHLRIAVRDVRRTAVLLAALDDVLGVVAGRASPCRGERCPPKAPRPPAPSEPGRNARVDRP